jgi:hypothetical protein
VIACFPHLITDGKPETDKLNPVKQKTMIPHPSLPVIAATFAIAAQSAEAAAVLVSATKPSSNVLAQTTTDGTAILAFDALQDTATPIRYSWGQSFTVGASAWEVNSISVQYYLAGSSLFDPVDLDAKIKLVLFTYNSANFDAAAWGNYTTPGVGAAAVYTEVFDFTTNGAESNWLTFDFTTNQTLAANQQYGFALWATNPNSGGTGATTGGDLGLYHTNTVSGYAGGERLRIRSDNGNGLPGGDLNFVIQTVPEPGVAGLFALSMAGLLRRRRA